MLIIGASFNSNIENLDESIHVMSNNWLAS